MIGLDLVKFTAEHADGVISCTPVDKAESFFNRLLKSDQVIPKFHKGKLIGFAAYYRTCAPLQELQHVPDWTLPEQYSYGPYVFVDLVVIHPKYRKQRILEYFIDRIKKLKPSFHAGFWLEQDGVWHAQERAENMRTNCGILAFDKITGMLNGRANVISLSTLARIAQDNEFLLFPMKVQNEDLAKLAYPFILHNDFHFETITNPFELGMFELPESPYVPAQSDEIGQLVDDEEAKTIRGSKKFWKQVVAPVLGMGGGAAAGGALLGGLLAPITGGLSIPLGAALGGAAGGALVGPMTGRAPTLGETLTGAVAGGVGSGVGGLVGSAGTGLTSGATLGAGLGGAGQGLLSGASDKPGAVTGGSLLGAAGMGAAGGALGGFGSNLLAPVAGSSAGLAGVSGTGASLGAGTGTGALSGSGAMGSGIGSLSATGSAGGAGGLAGSALSSGGLGGTATSLATGGAAAGGGAFSLPSIATGVGSGAGGAIGGGSSAALGGAAQTLAKGASAGSKVSSMFGGSQGLLGAGLLGTGLIGNMMKTGTGVEDGGSMLSIPQDLNSAVAAAQQGITEGGMTPQSKAAGMYLTSAIPQGPAGAYAPVSDAYTQAMLNQSRLATDQNMKNYMTQLAATTGGPFSSEYNQLMGRYNQMTGTNEAAQIAAWQEAARKQGSDTHTQYLQLAAAGDQTAYQALLQAYGDRATADLAIQQYRAGQSSAPWMGLQNIGGTLLGNSINPLTQALMSKIGV